MKKYTYEEVKYFIETESDSGCKLLNDEYVDSKTKLTIKCRCNSEFVTTFSKFKHQRKRQCSKCGYKKPKSQTEVEQDVNFLKSKHSITLIDKYINRSTLFYAINEDGYYIRTNYLILEKGKSPELFIGSNKYTIENIKHWLMLNSKPFTLISDTYLKSNKKLIWRCEEGHVFENSWNNISKIEGCPFCNKKYPTREYNLLLLSPELCEEWDYEKNKNLPNEYTPHSGEDVWWKCKKGHTWKATPNHRQSGFGCKECYTESLKQEGNPSWKGGITPINQKIRNSKEYQGWRKSVYERDNFACRCCGYSKSGSLHAHHIQNFSENEELRFCIDNGITLCNDCHNPNVYGSFHNTYGTKNNTIEQLEDYIELYKEDVEKILKEIS